MNYFFWDCFSRKGNTLRDIDNTDPFPGITTRMLRKGIHLDVPESTVAEFFFDETPKGIIPELFSFPAFLMTPALFSALKECGVDNIQSWPAKITDRETGETYDYILGNIIGIVDIIDNSASDIAPQSPTHIAVLYKKIAFKEDDPNTPHLFRPANKRTAMVVSEKVRTHLEKLGTFPHVSFHNPENYAEPCIPPDTQLSVASPTIGFLLTRSYDYENELCCRWDKQLKSSEQFL